MANIREYLKKLEWVAAPVALLGLLFKYLHFPASGILLIMGFLTLGVVYWAMSLRPVPDAHAIEKFAFKLGYLSLAIGVVGIIYIILHWPGGQVIKMVGLLGMLASIVLLLYKRTENEQLQAAARGIMFRLALVGVILAMI